MSEAERTGLDHVVLPRRRPGLALLERHRPSPADNVLDAELAAFAAAGDTVLDPWAGTGSVARRAVGHGMRAVAADASPFSQLAAIALLNAPDPSVLDAAFAQLAGSRRVDVPLRQHIEELYASRCAACRRPIVVDQFIWPRDGDAPGRKIYRCASCDASIGGPEERVAPVDEVDLAKLGIERAERPPVPIADEAEELPPAPVGLTEIDEASDDDDEARLRSARPAARRSRHRRRSTRRAGWASVRASPPPCVPTRSPSARRRASATARSTSSSGLGSRSSTEGTSSSPSCSTCTPRATCTRCTPSGRRSTARCATSGARRRCAWHSRRACCRQAG